MSYYNNYASTVMPSYANGYGGQNLAMGNNPYAQQQQQQLQQLQQLQQMQQPQQGQQIMQQPVQQTQEYLKGKKVSTIEEAKATAIEFDGSVYYFPSTDGKSIYSKQLNLDGTVAIYEYKLNEENANNDTVEENKVIPMEILEKQNDIIQDLNNRIGKLESETDKLLKELGGK